MLSWLALETKIGGQMMAEVEALNQSRRLGQDRPGRVRACSPASHSLLDQTSCIMQESAAVVLGIQHERCSKGF